MNNQPDQINSGEFIATVHAPGFPSAVWGAFTGASPKEAEAQAKRFISDEAEDGEVLVESADNYWERN